MVGGPKRPTSPMVTVYYGRLVQSVWWKTMGESMTSDVFWLCMNVGYPQSHRRMLFEFRHTSDAAISQQNMWKSRWGPIFSTSKFHDLDLQCAKEGHWGRRQGWYHCENWPWLDGRISEGPGGKKPRKTWWVSQPEKMQNQLKHVESMLNLCFYVESMLNWWFFFFARN